MQQSAMKQGSRAWVEARLGKVTSSRLADVLRGGRSGGLSKAAETYMLQLISEILTGEPADDIRSKPIMWGNQHEDGARASYQFDRDCNVTQTGFVPHPEIEGFGGSPDSLVGNDGILEIKCPFNSTVHLTTLLTQQVPEEYEPQVQGNLCATGRQWCDFVSYDPRMPAGADIVVIRVDRDEVFIEEIEDRVKRFIDHLNRKLDKVRLHMGDNSSINQGAA